MAHKHTCLDCGRTIAEGNFDCELDRDHDFERCDDCTDAEPLDDGGPVPSSFLDAWREYEEGYGSEKPPLTHGELHDRIRAAGLYFDKRSTRKQWVELFQRIFEGTIMKVYTITHRDGQVTYISCDLVRAEAPIRAGFDHGEDEIDFSSTPFQTADANHRLERAAELVLHYTDRESCAEDDQHPCDCARRIKSIKEV